jgi:carbamoyltransferase
MLETCQVRSSISLPAITHVDGSARPQTVDAATHPRFHALLGAFKRRTGCPILLNTSFNLRGEPIVCSPVDALLCFVRSDLDCLVLEDLVLDRRDVPPQWLEWFAGATAERSGVSSMVYTLL